ncbi:hypothetical protein [Sulfurimonas sp.]|uniref:hypothetical protein n=1 Tax=Sulfurimonas sp. TaxID=2022749 RepID=UPI002AB288FA|nr:hypothetical protein [Sulfurimonas sp.]
MSKIQKVKRVVLIALSFGLATYLIMSGSAMLDKEEKASLVEVNATSEVHSDAVK